VSDRARELRGDVPARDVDIGVAKPLARIPMTRNGGLMRAQVYAQCPELRRHFAGANRPVVKISPPIADIPPIAGDADVARELP